MAGLVVTPDSPFYPNDDNEGPLRVVGYDDSALDSLPGHPGWVGVVFVLSRVLNRFEDHFNEQDANGEDRRPRLSGKLFQIAASASELPQAVADANGYLANLERRGKEAIKAHDAALAEARERLGTITFE